MKIIAIIGPSGAGKDTAARMLAEMTGYHILVSYTTRPIRDGEEFGREHYFVSDCTVPIDKMLAYTVYGEYEYWVTLKQVVGTCIYVIDEVGMMDIRKRHPDIDLVTIHIETTRFRRRMRGVTTERMVRDDLREQLPMDSFDFCITNNGSLEELESKLRNIADTLTKKP